MNEKTSWLMEGRFLCCRFLFNAVAQLERPYVTLLLKIERPKSLLKCAINYWALGSFSEAPELNSRCYNDMLTSKKILLNMWMLPRPIHPSQSKWIIQNWVWLKRFRGFSLRKILFADIVSFILFLNHFNEMEMRFRNLALCETHFRNSYC